VVTDELGRVALRPEWVGRRIAVLGDVHSNAHAFASTLDAVERLAIGRVIFNGDLLTYGCTPLRCIDLLESLSARFDAVFLAGNHEAFYFGGTTPAPGGPIGASVQWTLEMLADQPLLKERFEWRDACVVGDVLVSHANPFSKLDWRYLNSAAEEIEAAQSLRSRGARVGVFGHTHRARCTRMSSGEPQRLPVDRPHHLGAGTTWILNSGSVGQPRGEDAAWIELDLGAQTTTVHRQPYNVQAHLDAIDAAAQASPTLTPATVRWLKRYFP